MDRRDFFRRMSGKKQAIRPPGTQPGEAFYSRCDGCKACVKACTQNIIRLVSGLPVVDFAKAGCTFCGRCGEVCDRKAIVASAALEETWNWRAEISPDCLDKHGVVCRTCESSCEEDAIKFRPALGGRTDVNVLVEVCIGCGACVASCPKNAISMKISDGESITLLKEAVA